MSIHGLKPQLSSVFVPVLLQGVTAVPRFFPPIPLHIQKGFHGTNLAPDAAPAPHPQPAEENPVGHAGIHSLCLPSQQLLDGVLIPL